MTVTCTEGYFDDSFLVVIWENSSSELYTRVSLLLNQGESKEITCEIPMGDLNPGDYSVSAYDGGEITPRVNFSYAKYTTTINEVMSTNGDAVIYDLQGRRIIHPQPGHIYIRANKLLRL